MIYEDKTMDDASFAITQQLVTSLKEHIENLPEQFYGTFKFTSTGNNLTHPLTLGFLCKIIWELENVHFVGIDVRLNLGHTKFQPDIVAYNAEHIPVLCVDYESPNSSDARILSKDIEAYSRWSSSQEYNPSYIVITSLPDCASPKWQLRHTGQKGYNKDFKGQLANVRKNPFEFWFSYYRDTIVLDDHNIFIVNISSRDVVIVDRW